MRSAPVSRVILTDEEVEVKMRSEGVSASDIEREMMERRTLRAWAQDGYNTTQPAPEYRRLTD